MKGVVLVTQRLTECEAYPEVRECLDRRWGVFFQALGLLPVPVAHAVELEAYMDLLRPVGVVLTGGNDLSSVGGGALSRDRDDLEGRLVERALARELPIVGVCRGMQLLAQRAGFALERCAGHVAREHGLVAAAPSRYPALSEHTSVNSFHNFAVRGRPGAGLEVTLASEDGVAEAVEHPTLPLVGIMWHPERYAKPRRADLELFRQVLLP